MFGISVMDLTVHLRGCTVSRIRQDSDTDSTPLGLTPDNQVMRCCLHIQIDQDG